MEQGQFLNDHSTLVPVTVLFISLSLYFLWKPKRQLPKKTPPEVSGALPIIGHLHLLAGSTPLHKKMGQMADKYGPIYILRTGVHRDLIVSNWEIAKECFTTHDKVFANRPKTLAGDILTCDGAFFAFSPYGPYWRQARKIATMELLSNHRLKTLRHVRESEAEAAIKELYSGDKEMDMKRWFGDIILNLMSRIIVGKRYLEATESESAGESERCREAMTNLLEYLGKFFVSDAIPWLWWLDFENERAMKAMIKELDRVSQRWIQEHKIDRGANDFMDVMLSALEADDELRHSRFDSDTIIKYTCVGMLMAGRDTVMITLTWTLSLLLNNRAALTKAQLELDHCVDRDRKVTESDIKSLVYLKAVVKEAMRLYPALPLSAPHQSIEDCTIAGHHVPAGTRLIVNLSKLQRDPNVWARAEEFVPERFLEGGEHASVDVYGQSFELFPFGSGRRICPGASLALQMVHLYLAALLQGFHITTAADQPVDMTESSGFHNYKTSPLRVLLTPRLSTHLYS